MAFEDDDHFTLANIPFGIASRVASGKLQSATRLKEYIYFIPELLAAGLFDSPENIRVALAQVSLLVRKAITFC
jgi:hypothetical protein